jgi:hypothetical protein
MLKKLFERWGRYRIIMDRVDNQPYLERYYVFLKDRERFPFNIFVHKFLKSDTEDVHDHPWPFFTIFLKVATGNGDHSLTQQAEKSERLLNGVVLEAFAGPVPVSITEWNWTQMSHVGHCSVPVSNNVTGDFWSAINGYNGNNI